MAMRTPHLGKRNRRGLSEDGGPHETAFAKTCREMNEKLLKLAEERRLKTGRTHFTRSIIQR